MHCPRGPQGRGTSKLSCCQRHQQRKYHFFPSGIGKILVLDEREETKLNHFTLCTPNCENALSLSLPLSKGSSLAGATVLKSLEIEGKEKEKGKLKCETKFLN